MSRIGLIDVDGHNFPSIPLMKISAWHKTQGDAVEWYRPLTSGHCDMVYMSKVFSFTQDYQYVVDADVIKRGGSGYAIRLRDGKETYDTNKDQPLPEEIERQFPDYTLYGITDTAYGFLTRGCPRACAFCHVAKKEGKCSRKVANLSEWWNGQKNITLCDPNLLACKEHMDLLEQLRDSKALVDMNQGVDARLLNEGNLEALNAIHIKTIHFAWDLITQSDSVQRGLLLYADKGRVNKSRVFVYILVNFNTDREQDFERIYKVREMGFMPYIMIYDKEHLPIGHELRMIQRWCNNPFIWKSCKRFEEYWHNARKEII